MNSSILDIKGYKEFIEKHEGVSGVIGLRHESGKRYLIWGSDVCANMGQLLSKSKKETDTEVANKPLRNLISREGFSKFSLEIFYICSAEYYDKSRISDMVKDFKKDLIPYYNLKNSANLYKKYIKEHYFTRCETVEEIAKLIGVSPATISRIISSDNRFVWGTRRKNTSKKKDQQNNAKIVCENMEPDILLKDIKPDIDIKTEKIENNGGSDMKYKKGDVLYKYNKKTKELEAAEIIGVNYVLDKRIGSRCAFSEEELNKYMNEGTLYTDMENVKEMEIKRLEEKFNIKLKEV